MFSGCDPEKVEPLSNEKQITVFGFSEPAATGVINETAKTIAVNVPEGTNITALAPVIIISADATVSPASGVAQNFSSPVAYTVTAADNSTTSYIVTVTVAGSIVDNPNDWTELSGSMSENRTLKEGNYVINGTLTVSGNALLTMEPGVKIRFTGTNGGINVTTNAGLAMNGTAEKPIVIAGPVNNNNKGSWNKITYNSNRADNVMNYVHLINGGSGGSAYSAVVELENGQLKMTNCVIDGSAKNGVYAYQGTYTEFSNNEVKNCNAYPVYAYSDIATMTNIDATNVFTANTNNLIYIGGGNVKEDMTLKKLPVPWLLNGTISVSEAALFTVEEGVEIQFTNSNGGITVGSNAAMAMNGTSANPIRISGSATNTQKGSWNRIVYNSARQENLLNHVVLKNGGSGGSAYSAVVELEHGLLTMTNCIIDGSAKNGVYAYQGTYTEFSNNEIKNCNSYPVYAYSDFTNFKNMDITNTFNGNSKNYVYVGNGGAGNEDITLPKINIPWYFNSGLSVSNSMTFTIEAGAQLHFALGKKMEIGSEVRFVAEGTAGNRIVIRGAENEPGYWNGIRLQSALSGNKINYCDISGSGSDSGWNGNCNLYLYPSGNKMRLQIHNTTLTGSDYYGLGLEGAKTAFDQIDMQNVTISGCSGGNVWSYGTGATYNSLEEYLQ
ncbi:MAG: DUF5018 domain-containing protein [Bacteroidales bacterium]|jgi:hypothetical protein|nr:DUF5018 domain-containing protein [Bacteroidales bacterium]